MTRPPEQVEAARQLRALGFNNCQISRELTIPRGTIRDWLNPRGHDRQHKVDLRRTARPCQRCNRTEASLGVDYVYLLGLYLGDGYIAAHPKGVWRLRIVQDQRYTGLISECRLAMSAVTPTRVSIVKALGCVVITSYWKHWTHLFPQHGEGPKWLRRITMDPWQQALIDSYPGQLVRGLIHSDGCRHLNPVTTPSSRLKKRYVYPRYMFTNASDDIRFLFIEACERLQVRWTQTNARTIAVSRRADVELFDTFIGAKC